MSMGKLNLPPIEKRNYGNTPSGNVNYVSIPENIPNNIPSIISNHTERNSKVHIVLLDVLNQMNQMKLLDQGKLFYKLSTTSTEQKLSFHVIAPDSKDRTGSSLLSVDILTAMITRTGLFSLKVGNTTVLGKSFREWMSSQMKTAVKAFAGIKHRPTLEETSEWFILNGVTLLPAEQEQTAAIVCADATLEKKIQIVRLLKDKLDQKTLDLIKQPDPTGILVESIILALE